MSSGRSYQEPTSASYRVNRPSALQGFFHRGAVWRTPLLDIRRVLVPLSEALPRKYRHVTLYVSSSSGPLGDAPFEGKVLTPRTTWKWWPPPGEAFSLVVQSHGLFWSWAMANKACAHALLTLTVRPSVGGSESLRVQLESKRESATVYVAEKLLRFPILTRARLAKSMDAGGCCVCCPLRSQSRPYNSSSLVHGGAQYVRRTVMCWTKCTLN